VCRLFLLVTVAFLAIPASGHHLGEPPGFEKVLNEADRAFDKRSYEEALGGFRTALGIATGAQNQIYIEFRIAKALERLGRYAEARTALRTLAEAHPRDIKAPRALYVAARIRETALGDGPGAESELLALLHRYPTSDPAARALTRLTVLRADRSVADALALLKGIYKKYRRGPLAPKALYLAAGLYESEDSEDADASALALYEIIVRKYHRSGLYDDALWKSAVLLRKAKRPREALVMYGRLMATRRESWSIGSYNSVYLDRAAFETACVYLDELGDIERGLASLREFIVEYPHSVRRVEARKLLVATLLKVGKREEAARELAELKRRHPDSKHTREAAALFEPKKGT
jgi:TolA-binding protein